MSGYLNNKKSNIFKKTALVIFALVIGIVPNLSGYFNLATVADAADSGSYTRIGDNELRGVWIASVFNINFPSKTGLSAEQMKAEIDDIIKTCKETNLNAIFFQVRPTGDALYDSEYFPTSKYLTGRQGDEFRGGFDPLEYIVQAAHANNIELHAWINPYRITNGSAASPEIDLNALAENNPARQNPSWVVKYDGKLFYNPGLPEVRRLITDGVVEIVKNYDIDGIHFDDYFYPYPDSAGNKFDDDAAFKQYGSAYKTVGDFRRASVNTLVENVYNAIKKEKPSVRFGISPFGIWANQSTTTPTGSKTKGLESYYSIYSDAKAWVNGGYIDYICPQIYWAFSTSVAPFDTLVRWWSALVDGTNVDLYIGHAAYKVPTDFKSELELPRQVEYARAYMGTAGSVFYGYKDLAENSYKMKDNLAKLFANPLKVTKLVSNGKGVEAGRPLSGSTVTEAAVNILGSSDPAYPVYYKGEKVTRTKSGFFSVYVSLADGRNNLVFTQNNLDYTHVVNKGRSSAAPPSTYVYPQMDSYKIEVVSPTSNIITTPGDKITVRIQAPSNSAVTAKLGDTSVKLSPLTSPPDEGTYMTEVYSGTITLPNTQPAGELIDLSNIIYTAERGNLKASATGINIKLVNNTAYKACEVIKDYSHLKTSPTSDFYGDYLPSSVGMRDNIVAFRDGYYQLGFGGWIAAQNVVLTPERTLLVNRILSAAMENAGQFTEIRFAVTENVPVDAKCKDGVFTITLFNTPDGSRNLVYTENPMFATVKNAADKSRKTATYKFDLKDPDNWYGFDVVYEKGFIIIKVKNPMKKIEGNQPLKGLTIIVDAGHGGTDPGALGYLKNRSEKDFNLDISIALKTKLTALGANVIMIREKDETVDIYSRMDTYNALNPDLLISVHHNSLGDTQDLSLVRGLLPLYCNDAGRLLAKSVGRVSAAELFRYERDTRYQSLAMLRSHRFPSTLLEMSFMTNPDEYEFGNSAAGIERSADGIAKGVIAWIDDQQKFLK